MVAGPFSNSSENTSLTKYQPQTISDQGVGLYYQGAGRFNSPVIRVGKKGQYIVNQYTDIAGYGAQEALADLKALQGLLGDGLPETRDEIAAAADTRASEQIKEAPEEAKKKERDFSIFTLGILLLAGGIFVVDRLLKRKHS